MGASRGKIPCGVMGHVEPLRHSLAVSMMMFASSSLGSEALGAEPQHLAPLLLRAAQRCANMRMLAAGRCAGTILFVDGLHGGVLQPAGRAPERPHAVAVWAAGFPTSSHRDSALGAVRGARLHPAGGSTVRPSSRPTCSSPLELYAAFSTLERRPLPGLLPEIARTAQDRLSLVGHARVFRGRRGGAGLVVGSLPGRPCRASGRWRSQWLARPGRPVRRHDRRVAARQPDPGAASIPFGRPSGRRFRTRSSWPSCRASSCSRWGCR